MEPAARQKETAVRLAFGGVCQRPAGEPSKGHGLVLLPLCRRHFLLFKSTKGNAREEARSERPELKSKVEAVSTTLLFSGGKMKRGLDEHRFSCVGVSN